MTERVKPSEGIFDHFRLVEIGWVVEKWPFLAIFDHPAVFDQAMMVENTLGWLNPLNHVSECSWCTCSLNLRSSLAERSKRVFILTLGRWPKMATPQIGMLKLFWIVLIKWGSEI